MIYWLSADQPGKQASGNHNGKKRGSVTIGWGKIITGREKLKKDFRFHCSTVSY